jgi:hypothetical protein
MHINSKKIEQKHIKDFQTLSIKDRLNWSFKHAHRLYTLMDDKAKKNFWLLRNKGKKYLNARDLDKNIKRIK